jgi:hypothetical protein
MAEKRTIELDVKEIGIDALRVKLKEAKANAKAVAKEFGETSKEAKAAADAAGQLENKITEVRDASKSLKTQLKEAQLQVAVLSDKFGATSKEATDAAKAAGILKDKIADAKDLTDAFNPDAKFNSLSASIGGVLNGFQAYEGAMGLIGVESEDLQKTLLKVQSAMALSQGIQGALEAKDSFVQLGAVVKTAFTGMTAASKAFLVTGIGALIAGVALLVANWEQVSMALGFATEAQVLNNKVAQQATEAISKEVNAADKLSNSLKDETLNRAEKVKLIKEFQADYPGLLRNVNLEKDSIQSINEQLGDNIKLLQLQAEAEALASIREETYTKKSQLQLQLQTEAIENAGTATFNYGESAANGFLGFSSGAENAANATKKLGDFQNSSTKSLEKQIKSIDESEKSLVKKIDALKKTGAATGELTDTEKKAEEEAEKARQKAIQRAEERAAKRKSELEQLTQFLAAATKANLDAIKTDQQLELDAISEKYKAQIELAKKYNKDATQIIEAQRNEENLVNTKYIQLELDAEQLKQDKLNEIAEAQKVVDAKNIADKAALDKAAADAEISNAKAVAEQKAAIQMQGLDVALQGVQLIRGLFEQQKGVQKAAVIAESAIGIAKMIIANKLANVAALATPQAIATSGAAAVPVIALNNISTGIGIAANIAATGKALKTLGGGTAPSAPPVGGGGGGAGGVSAPNFNIVGNSGINQLAELGGQPIQAYVVSGEVTSAQALDRNRIQNATF